MLDAICSGEELNMSVSIIGCGWLGQALAKHLMTNKVDIIASYQSKKTHEKLIELDIPAAKLSLPLEDEVLSCQSLDDIANIDVQLFQKRVLIIAIPPQLKKGRLDYPLKIQQLIHMAELGNTAHIILLNSTAIYNGLYGRVDETSELNLSAEKVETLVDAEQAAKKFTKGLTILRLAGLVGPNRHPGKFLQVKRVFENAGAPVNLVHQVDVIQIIEKLIGDDNVHIEPNIYNVVSNTDSNRQQYYQVAAESLGLPLPQFSFEQQKTTGKKIIGERLRSKLNYTYKKDDLLTWLKEASRAL
ncbi:MAG: nucleoside-diphosphate-sugar epimerase [Cognaticolwellia sp.]